jgi:hypothetical protein
VARGEQGSAAKWAHAAMALAVRALGRGEPGAAPDPRAVLGIVERVMRQGDARSGAIAADLCPEDARALLRAWLDSLDLDLSEPELLAWMQEEGFAHADLSRRARRAHERSLREAAEVVVGVGADHAEAGGDGLHEGAPAAAGAVFSACIPAIPYAPAAAFLGREKGKLLARESEPRRVALVADGVGGMHGVTHTLDELRERGVPGFEVEVVGTDAHVDRRLPAAAEVELPFYAGLRVGVPSLHAAVEALAEGRYDIVHLCSPGPAGVAAALIARIMELPLVGAYHTELGVYAGLRSGDARLRAVMDTALAALYGQCEIVLSPSESADESLRALGIPGDRIGRWERGVDLSRFDPALRDPGSLPGELRVLSAGRLITEKGADLLADSFLAAQAADPRLHLVLAAAQRRKRCGPGSAPTRPS